MISNKTEQFLKLGYQVPNHYFERSKQRMLNRILMPSEQTTVVRPLWKKLTAAAAVIVLLLATKWSIDNYQPLSAAEFSDYDILLVESISVEEEDFDLWFEENYVLDIL